MKKCLTLVSLLALLCMLPSFTKAANNVAEDGSDTTSTWQYALVMTARGHETTGICIMEGQPDGQLAGTVVNEFGVKAFDFTRQKGRTRVMNVIGPLNKWYIRKVLRRDLNFIIRHLWGGKDATEKRRSITFNANGSVSVSNRRFSINYLFTPMTTQDDTLR